MRFFDRVKDTTTSTATPFTVSGTAPTSYQTFSARYTVGDNYIPVCIANSAANEWQVCYCTYSASNQLTVDQVIYSSNSDNAVTFSAGAKDIFVTLPSWPAKQQGKQVMQSRGFAPP